MESINNRIQITASAIGVLLGLSGILNHGIFEILQGNTPTHGFFIEAIGVEHRFWLHGTEGAFTVIHNFLITGILTVITGSSIVIWSLKYLHVKQGSTILLLLFMVLTLVGGGLGYIVLIIPVWAFATRINKTLDWWKKKLTASWVKKLSSCWKFGLTATLISWLVVMQLGIFGFFPGQNNPDTLLNIVFLFLFSSVLLACLTFICAIAGDIREYQHYSKV